MSKKSSLPSRPKKQRLVQPAAAAVRRPTVSPARLITKVELRQLVPYTPQHILRLEKRGRFPRRIQVGPNRVGWLLSEVESWIAARVAERDGGAPTDRASPPESL